MTEDAQRNPGDIATFIARLKGKDVSAKLSEPMHDDGFWYIDASIDGAEHTIEWSRAKGFGMWTSIEDAFGERPDVMVREPADAAERINKLATPAASAPSV
jgi:hypothetical protein